MGGDEVASGEEGKGAIPRTEDLGVDAYEDFGMIFHLRIMGYNKNTNKNSKNLLFAVLYLF